MTFTEFWEAITPEQGFLLAMIVMLGVMLGVMIVMLIASKIRWGSWFP